MFCKFHWGFLSKRRYSISIPGNKGIKNKKVPLNIHYSVAPPFGLFIFSVSHISSDLYPLSCVLFPRMCWIHLKREKIATQIKASKSNKHCFFSLFFQQIIIVHLLCAGHVLGTQQAQIFLKKILCSHRAPTWVGGEHKETNKRYHFS